MILHSSAERIGSGPTKLLQYEESRLWSGLLSSLRFSLPCPQCKRHYSDFLQRHPLPSISQQFVREWLFTLHHEVNQRNNKPCDITIENVPVIYSKPFHFSLHVGIFQQHMRLALMQKWCSREDIQRTIRFLEEMRRFYDFF